MRRCGTWLRGRFVRADEVRPAYARDIQERLQLQSEVTAAREAVIAGQPRAAVDRSRLLGADGLPDQAAIAGLLAGRDERPVDLRE